MHHLKNITIALPSIMVDGFSVLTEEGLLPSRSEGIRRAIEAFLQKEKKNMEILNCPIVDNDYLDKITNMPNGGI